MNTARAGIGLFGTQTAAIGAGGYNGTGPKASTELWNGTSWTNLPSMGTGRTQQNKSGTQSAGLGYGGYTGGGTQSALTEEWTGEVATANSKTLTTS